MPKSAFRLALVRPSGAAVTSRAQHARHVGPVMLQWGSGRKNPDTYFLCYGSIIIQSPVLYHYSLCIVSALK